MQEINLGAFSCDFSSLQHTALAPTSTLPSPMGFITIFGDFTNITSAKTPFSQGPTANNFVGGRSPIVMSTQDDSPLLHRHLRRPISTPLTALQEGHQLEGLHRHPCPIQWFNSLRQLLRHQRLWWLAPIAKHEGLHQLLRHQGLPHLRQPLRLEGLIGNSSPNMYFHY